MPDKITDTKAWTVAERLNSAIADLQKRENIPEPVATDLQRRASFIADRLLRADPGLVPTDAMSVLSANLEGATTQVTQFASNRNRQHAQQALNALGKATQAVMDLPLLTTAGELSDTFGDALMQAKSSADAVIQSVTTEAKGLREKLAKIDEQQSGFDKEIQSAKQRLDQAIADYQKQFSESENRRTQQFGTTVEGAKSEADKVVEQLKEEAQKARDDIASQGDALLEQLRRRNEETKALARAMGARGVSSTFQAAANKNKTAADILRTIAIALLITMAAIVIWALWDTTSKEAPPLELTLLRFLAALLVGIPAAYLARESSRQRSEAIRNRRIELELASLTPFIEPLDVQTKADLRKKLVETYFGRAFDIDDRDEEKDSVPLGGTLLDVIKAVKTLVH